MTRQPPVRNNQNFDASAGKTLVAGMKPIFGHACGSRTYRALLEAAAVDVLAPDASVAPLGDGIEGEDVASM